MEADPSEGSSYEERGCSREDEHGDRSVDRQNDQLRAMLADPRTT